MEAEPVPAWQPFTNAEKAPEHGSEKSRPRCTPPTPGDEDAWAQLPAREACRTSWVTTPLAAASLSRLSHVSHAISTLNNLHPACSYGMTHCSPRLALDCVFSSNLAFETRA